MTDTGAKIRERLSSVTHEVLEGENLWITLLQLFNDRDWPEEGEEEDEFGWFPSNIRSADHVLDAVHGHYTESVTTAAEDLRASLTKSGDAQYRKGVEDMAKALAAILRLPESAQKPNPAASPSSI